MCKSVHLICKYDAIYARCLSITHLQRVGRAWENHRYRGTTVINILGLYSWWKLIIWELVTGLMSLRGASDEHDIKYKQRGSKSTPNSPNYGAKAKTKGSNPYLFLFSVDPPQDALVEVTIDFLTVSVDWGSSPSLAGSSGSCSQRNWVIPKQNWNQSFPFGSCHVGNSEAAYLSSCCDSQGFQWQGDAKDKTHFPPSPSWCGIP